MNRTALHWAALLGEHKLLRWLLESGQYRWVCAAAGFVCNVCSRKASWGCWLLPNGDTLCIYTYTLLATACTPASSMLSTRCRVRGEGEIRAIDVDDNEDYSALAHALAKG